MVSRLVPLCQNDGRKDAHREGVVEDLLYLMALFGSLLGKNRQRVGCPEIGQHSENGVRYRGWVLRDFGCSGVRCLVREFGGLSGIGLEVKG